jgi:replicative DNA helicase
MEMSDPGAERAVLAGLFTYGIDAYIEVSEIVDYQTFGTQNNQIIYKCIEKILQSESEVDLPAILSAAQQLNFSDVINTKQELEYIKSLMDFPIKRQNVIKFATQIKKFEFARQIKAIAESISREISEIKGDETIDEIISMMEDPLTAFLQNDSLAQRPEQLGDGIDDYLEFLLANKCDQIGIPTGFPRYDAAIGGGLRRKCVDLVSARPKAQPLTAKILTPDGWITMGDVKVGDKVCHPSGSISTITHLIPQGTRECFEFCFDDGAKTEACGDHLWKIKSRRYKDYKIASWNSLKHEVVQEVDRNKWQIPLLDNVHLNKSQFVIHPYILGVIIGDGGISQNSINITSADQELIERLRSLITDDLQVNTLTSKYAYSITRRKRGGTQNIYIQELQRLQLMGLTSHFKFIPTNYLFSSAEDRWQLLRGLMDTDGCGSNNKLEYSTTSKRLADDFVTLVRSLGGKCKNPKARYTSPDKGVHKFLSYKVHLSFNDNTLCFELSRKRDKCKIRTKPALMRSLNQVTSVGSKQCQCITIDNPDGLYITDDYIVTHNCGKSVMADNVAIHIARTGIPILMLDTEMSKVDHLNRIIAMISGVPINEIATGKFVEDEEKTLAIQRAVEEIKRLPYTYVSVAGAPFEHILNTIKRWIIQEVGKDDNGVTKDCAVVFDYLKMMSAGSISNHVQEYQALGFQITALHNLAVKYDFPCLSFVQLNRDGITKESTDAVSGSDRLIWLCTSFSIFKVKSPEELANDGPSAGNRKLVPIVSRHGPGMEDGNYINVNMVGELARLIELRTRDEFAALRASGGAIAGAEVPFDTDTETTPEAWRADDELWREEDDDETGPERD